MSKDGTLAKWMADFEVFLVENDLCVASIVRKEDGQWRVALRKNGEHPSVWLARGPSILLAFINVHKRARGERVADE